MPDCSSVQKSLAWCQGRPELPGVKRRIYYISKYDVLQWPKLPHDANGRLTSAAYTGDFVLRADAKWKFIDIISDKSQLTSDAQGEYPSQTQLNKLVAVHPGVDEDASAAAAYLNNNDNVFLVEDMRGAVRVVGSDKWPTKTTVTQDLGQGATGSTSTTINVEATDECPAPFYAGKIATEDGEINPEGNPNQATGGGNSGGYAELPGDNTGSNSGGNSGSSDSGNTNTGGSTGGSPKDDSKIIKCSDGAVFNNIIKVNGKEYDVSSGHIKVPASEVGVVSMDGTNLGNLTGINKSTGNEFTITSSWDGLSAYFSIYKSDAQVGNLFEVTREKHDHTGNTCVWFIIEIVSGGNGNTGGNAGGDND